MSKVNTSTLEEEFQKYKDLWIKDTLFVHQKDPETRYCNPHYQKIISLGKDVIPLILKELQIRRDWWFRALEILTEANPVPEEERDKRNVKKMTKTWVEWGQKQGYIE